MSLFFFTTARDLIQDAQICSDISTVDVAECDSYPSWRPIRTEWIPEYRIEQCGKAGNSTGPASAGTKDKELWWIERSGQNILKCQSRNPRMKRLLMLKLDPPRSGLLFIGLSSARLQAQRRQGMYT